MLFISTCPLTSTLYPSSPCSCLGRLTCTDHIKRFPWSLVGLIQSGILTEDGKAGIEWAWGIYSPDPSQPDHCELAVTFSWQLQLQPSVPFHTALSLLVLVTNLSPWLLRPRNEKGDPPIVALGYLRCPMWFPYCHAHFLVCSPFYWALSSLTWLCHLFSAKILIL